MAIKQDIAFYKGENVNLDFTVTCSTTTGSSPDISAWTVRLTAKVNADDTGSVFSKLGTISASPVCRVNFVSTDTQGLAAGYYPYDLRRVDAGSEAVLSIGNMHLIWSVLYP